MENLITPINIKPGVSEYVKIALKSWFITNGIKLPDSGVVITQNHQFTKGLYGFLDCQLAPKKNQLTAKTIGDFLGEKLQFDLKVFLPGSYEELHGTMQYLLNQPIIVLIEDLCETGIIYQIGTEITPAYITHEFKSGTDKDGSKGYEATISTTGCNVQLYGGSIKIYEKPYPNNAYPIFFSSNKINNTTFQSMRDEYCDAYSYAASKILNLVAAHGAKSIQIEYQNDQAEVISLLQSNIDTSSITAFINALSALINAVNTNHTITLYGSKLLVADSTSEEQYLGIALIDDEGLQTESGVVIETEGGQTLIPE